MIARYIARKRILDRSNNYDRLAINGFWRIIKAKAP